MGISVSTQNDLNFLNKDILTTVKYMYETNYHRYSSEAMWELREIIKSGVSDNIKIDVQNPFFYNLLKYEKGSVRIAVDGFIYIGDIEKIKRNYKINELMK